MPPSSPSHRPTRAAAASSRTAFGVLSATGSRSNIAANPISSALSKDPDISSTSTQKSLPYSRTKARSNQNAPSASTKEKARATRASSRAAAMHPLPSVQLATRRLQMTTAPPTTERASTKAAGKRKAPEGQGLTERDEQGEADVPRAKRRLLDEESIEEVEDSEGPPSGIARARNPPRNGNYGRKPAASTSTAEPSAAKGKPPMTTEDEEEREFINEQLGQAAMEESLKELKEAARRQEESAKQRLGEASGSQQTRVAKPTSASRIPRELLPEATFGATEGSATQGLTVVDDDDDMGYVDTSGWGKRPDSIHGTPSKRGLPSPSTSDKENRPPPSLPAALLSQQPPAPRRESLASARGTPRRNLPLQLLSPSVRSAGRASQATGPSNRTAAPMHSTPLLRARGLGAPSGNFGRLSAQSGLGTPSRESLSFGTQRGRGGGGGGADADFEFNDEGLDISGFTEEWKEPDSPSGARPRRPSLMDLLEPGHRQSRAGSRSRASAFGRGGLGAAHLPSQASGLAVLEDNPDDPFGFFQAEADAKRATATEQFHQTREDRARAFVDQQMQRGEFVSGGQARGSRASTEVSRPALDRRTSMASSVGDRTARTRQDMSAPPPPLSAARSPIAGASDERRRSADDDLSKPTYPSRDPSQPSHDPLRLWRYAGPVEALLPFDEFCALSEAKHQEEDRLERERRAELKEKLARAKESEEREKRIRAGRSDREGARTPPLGLALRIAEPSAALPPPSASVAPGYASTSAVRLSIDGGQHRDSSRPLQRFVQGRTLPLSPPLDRSRTRGFDLSDLPPWEAHKRMDETSPIRPTATASEPKSPLGAESPTLDVETQHAGEVEDDADAAAYEASPPTAVQGALFGTQVGVDVWASIYDDGSSDKATSQAPGSDSDGLAYMPTLPKVRRSARTKGGKKEGGESGEEVEERRKTKTPVSKGKAKSSKAQQGGKMSVDELVRLLPVRISKRKSVSGKGVNGRAGKALGMGTAAGKSRARAAAKKTTTKGKESKGKSKSQVGTRRSVRGKRGAREVGDASSSSTESDASTADSTRSSTSEEEGEQEDEEPSFFDEIPKARGPMAVKRLGRAKGTRGKRVDKEEQEEEEEEEGRELTPRTMARRERIAYFKSLEDEPLIEELAIE